MRYNASVPSYPNKNEFSLRTTPHRGVLVNSAGVSSAVRDEGGNRRRNEEDSAGLCVSGGGRTSPWVAWCKPAILLLVVVLVIVLFVFVAGIVLYVNCK